MRRRLDTTALEVVETHLWPDGTTDSDGRILESYAEVGTETTDRLECIPASIYISRIIRHKVVARAGADRSILTPPLPKAAIDKGMAEPHCWPPSYSTSIFTTCHSTRQIDRYRQYGLRLPAATVSGWYEAAVDSLHLLYRLLREKVMASQYIQTDESTVPVVDNDRHRTRKGYQWCVRDASPEHCSSGTTVVPDRKIPPENSSGLPRHVPKRRLLKPTTSSCGIAGVWRGLLGTCAQEIRGSPARGPFPGHRSHPNDRAIVRRGERSRRRCNDTGQRALLRKQKAYPVIVMIEKWCLHTYPPYWPKASWGKP